MADQRITELVELTQVGTASNDVLPIADVSASQTKKIQVKSLIQAGFNLADASTLDISKINQGSAAKLGTNAFANDAVTYAKIQNVSATNRLLGRSSAGAGDIEEIACTAFARTILDDANASTARSTLGLGAVATGDTINTSLLENDSVTNAKIATGAVDTTELANDSVTSAKIDTGAVDTTALASGSVTLAKMAANSVSTTQVVDSGITQSKLASSAVATINIADSGVTQSKLASDAVATVNIADSGVTQSKLAADAVATVNIVDSGITQSKLASDAVATVNIADANVTLAKMASNSVGTSQLVDSGITQSKLASDSVDTVNLVDSGVTQSKIASAAVDTINIAALAITNAKIANSTIEASKLNLANGSIDGAVISGASIPSGVFASGAIVDSDIADNTVTFSKLQEVATDVLIGRSTAGSGDLETIALTAAGRALLDDVNASAQRTTLGLGTIATRNTIASGDFDAGAIVASDIGNGQVTTAKIADSGVTSVKIADDAVITSKIADANVTQAKMASGSVNTAQLVDSGVTQAKLASDAVDTINIADSAVVNAKIANSTISAEKLNLASGSIDGSVISGSTILSGSFASGVVDTEDIADNAVTFGKMQQVSSDVLVGRATAGSGDLETITLTSAGRALLDDANASAQRITLGLGSIATQDASSVAITGGTAILSSGTLSYATINGGVITGITDLAITDGGTGASNASDARDNLGLTIGSDVQAYSAILSGVSDQFTSANTLIYASASGIVSSAPFTSFGRSIVSGSTASEVRSTLGLGSIATQAANNVNITGGTVSGVTLTTGSVTISGGTISGITDLAIADGGTGASTASGARANLGLSIGSDVQAYSAILSGVSEQFATADTFIYASSSGVVSSAPFTNFARSIVSGSTASGVRSTLGLGSIATQSASGVNITGGTISGVTFTGSSVTINGGVISGITDLAIADGGTGASTASGARTNLGLSIDSDVQAYDAGLQSIAGLTTSSGQIIYTTGSDTYATSTITAAGRALIDDASATAQRTTLGLGSLAIQNTVASGDYGAGSIATADIADSAITTAKIVNSGITTAKIVDNNITTAKINDSAVTTAKIADSGVTTVKIASGAVTLAKITPATQSNIILGRATASGGVFEEIACTAAARSILDDVSVEDIRETLGLGTLATQNGTFSGTSTGSNTGDQTITLTGDVTGTGTGTFAATIADNAVTTAKINAGAVTTAKIVDSGVTALKLAGQSTVIVTNSTPAGSGTYIGQQWLNTSTSYEYTWDGSSWLRQAALNTVTISGDSVYSFSTTYPDSFSAIISPSLNTQSANAVFVGPASGSDAAPTFRALVGSDLPTATSGTTGVMRPGAGLVMNGNQIDHSNSIASGTFYKVVVDGQGHVSSGATALVAADIPVLSASKITTGTFGSGFIADNSINGEKLADYSVTKFGETTPSAQFTGQFFFNPLEKDLFLWDGNVWNPVGVSIGEIVFAGTYNASGNTVATVSAEGSAAGLTIGQPLPSPSATFNRYYVVVESGGTGTSPAPETELNPPDLLLCNGTAWVEIDVSSTYTSQTASQIGFTPAANVSSTNVQAAIEEVSTECRNANNIASGVLDESYGGTGQSSYTKGDLIAASGATDLGLVSVGSDGQVLTADSTEDTGLTWTTPSSGTVLSVTVGAPMSVTSGTTTPNITISGATTAGSGVVRLTDSTSTTSSTLAATATAVKTAYDLANAALPKTGGVVTGTVTFGTTGVLAFEGASDDDYEITLASANASADRVVTLPDTTGTVVTTGDSGTVTNTMLAGSIADTKLNTISTAGKIDNSATTATSANTASAIVARDGSGDFSAGTISATIDEGSF